MTPQPAAPCHTGETNWSSPIRENLYVELSTSLVTIIIRERYFDVGILCLGPQADHASALPIRCSMTAPDYIDRQSFQSLLANAYSVQQSGMSPQSLAAIIEIQHTIANCKIDAGSAMNLIADRAQAVANASGIGIALLEGNQLIHRAGNGTASQIVGSHLMAVLGASSSLHPRREILRVEDARTDARIEADICRQFEARALLMVPIYREGAMVGVIEVLFNEPHRFDEPELRTYQLMSTLAGDASLLPTDTEEVSPSTVPHALWRMAEVQQHGLAAGQSPVVPISQESPFVRALASIRRSSQQLSRRRFDFSQTRLLLALRSHVEAFGNLRSRSEYFRELVSRMRAYRESIVEVANRNGKRLFALRPDLSPKAQWNALAICLVIGLAVAAAMTRHESRVLRVADPPVQSETTATSTQTPPVSADLISSSEMRAQTATAVREAGAPSPAFKRRRVGNNEVDYIAQDVTIREFRSAPAPTSRRAFPKQVNIGEDVTVRYFDSKPVSKAEKPDSTTEQALKD